jgi:adenosine deaminase
MIGVSRIDHGVNALEDPALCKLLAQRQVGLTVCQISNSFVADGPKADVVKQMLDLGLQVTLNSDDPAYFGGYIEENFVLVQRQLDLGPAELVRLSRNAFDAAWLPPAIKESYQFGLSAYAAAQAPGHTGASESVPIGD